MNPLKLSLICLALLISGVVIGSFISIKLLSSKLISEKKELYKMRSYFVLLRKWIEVKQAGKTLEQHLISKGYNKIAVYGMGDIGKILVDDLKNTSVEVVYGIDQNGGNPHIDLFQCKPSEDMSEVDVIIITPVFIYDEVAEMLSELVPYKLEAIDDLIYEMG